DQPPCANPSLVSSSGPPGACMTPSRVRKVCRVSRMVVSFMCDPSGCEMCDPSGDETWRDGQTHRRQQLTRVSGSLLLVRRDDLGRQLRGHGLVAKALSGERARTLRQGAQIDGV